MRFLAPRALAPLAVAVLLAVPVPGLAADPPAPPPAIEPDDPIFARAAAALRLEGPARLGIQADDLALFGGDRFRLPLFDALAHDVRRAPTYVAAFRDQALAAATSPGDAASFAFGRVGVSVRRTLSGDPLADLAAKASAPEALGAALVALGADAAAREKAARVPPEVARPCALVLLAAARFRDWRERALAALTADERARLEAATLALARDGGVAERDWAFLEDVAARVDLGALAAGTEDLARAAERAARDLAAAAQPGAAPFELEVATPLGLVRVDGTRKATAHAIQGDCLLLVDLGGDDTYPAVGGTVASILIDVAGDDRYDASAAGVGGIAAGRLGASIVVDVAGKDSYRAGSFGLGAGCFGAGILCDLAGDDVYEGDRHVQGAGLFGAGVLLDAAGNDRYRAFTQAQGYGFTLGCGLLVDREGDDVYVADDATIRHPAPQTAEHNVSFAQGAAFGRRADLSDGRSLAGGAGLLFDGAGDDRYSCGVFGQGCGYWYGVGILADAGGADEYAGVWYVQGSAAHFAVGVLHDGAGADRYRATMNASQGCGHDLSVGLLYDGAGDDRYEAPSLSLGAGSANGLGVLLDRAGADRYVIAGGPGLGGASAGASAGLRRHLKTIGLFLDLGKAKDRDVYEGKTATERGAGPGKEWTQKGTAETPPGERGAGIDEK